MHFFVGFLFFMPAVRTKDARSETCNFVECISKKYPKWNTKKWYAIFCIMKNAAGKQHIHLHIHTYALRRNALHAIALETELSCEIQTQKYILKLKCDCLSKCKQSKGCAGLTHTHTDMHIPYTDTQCTGNKCIFVHLADTQRVAPLWVGVASFGERRTQCIIKKAFFSITHFPGTSRAQQIDI